MVPEIFVFSCTETARPDLKIITFIFQFFERNRKEVSRKSFQRENSLTAEISDGSFAIVFVANPENNLKSCRFHLVKNLA